MDNKIITANLHLTLTYFLFTSIMIAHLMSHYVNIPKLQKYNCLMYYFAPPPFPLIYMYILISRTAKPTIYTHKLTRRISSYYEY